MKKKSCIVFLLFLASVVVLTACSSKDSGGNEPDRGGGPSAETAGDAPLAAERKIIYTASFSVVTQDYAAALTMIEGSLAAGEWFDSVSRGSETAFYRARVLSSRLDAFVKSISDGVGADHVFDYLKTAADISLEYYGKQVQIESLETEYAQLTALMERPTITMNEIITIRARQTELDNQLRKLRGELNQYGSLVEYSTVEIWVRKGVAPEKDKPFFTQAGETFAAAWQALGTFLKMLAYILLAVLPFALVLGTPAALIVYFVKKRKK